ncbi:hypothetical protein CPT_Shady_067 [Streptomyces phage Shady]|uniref:Uncharacterized protein n=1 Tax=Streptomyces phage Shady TaxID=2767585 RepID=A0A873WI29_9CAUD|nr:hypothetical protein CPT_Shady_067 [Streptomyces phage Shady]
MTESEIPEALPEGDVRQLAAAAGMHVTDCRACRVGNICPLGLRLANARAALAETG